jgi:hypothetical protein
MGGRRSLRRSRSLFKAARDLDVDSSFDEIIAAETALFSGPGAASKG